MSKRQHAELLFAIFIVGSLLAHGLPAFILGVMSLVEAIRSVYYGICEDRAAALTQGA